MWSVASPIATPGFKLKKSVTLVNWLMWFTAWGPSVVFQSTSAFSGTRFLPSSDRMYSRERSSGWARAESSISRMTWYWSVGFLIR